MFSPIGKKRIMVKNYQRAQESGVPVQQVASKNALDDRSLGSFGSFGSFTFGSDDFSTSSALTPSRQRKKRPKNKKFLNPSTLDNARKQGEKARKNAVRKLTHAAVRFRKDRDGAMLACFETRSLGYDEFRVMLKKVFFLEFTDAEFEEAFKLFDTDNSRDVDGSEFLVYFTHLATIWKKEEKALLLKKQQDHVDAARHEEAQKAAASRAREQQAVDYDYGDEDSERARAKLAAAAKHYIKGHPAAKNVDAFEVAYLTPFEFRNLCFQTFDLKLTPKEVGALVEIYDQDDKGLVSSPYFLVQFIKMGNEQRMVDHSRQVVLTRQATADLRETAERKVADMEAALERGIERDFSEEDQQNAVEKLRVVAAKFDKNHPASLSLDGFSSVRTSPGVFREMLKRTFNLILPPKELGALVKFFDTDNSDTVNNSDFLTYFSRASTTGRFAMRSYMIAKQRKMIQDAEEEQHRKLNAQWGNLEDRIKFEFTEEEKESAIRKLTELARKHFNDKVSNIGLKAFQVATMGPAVWREMMKRSFGVKITDGELAYFISILGNAQKEIDCIQFVLKFNALVFEERSKGRTHQLKLDQDRQIEERIKETNRLIAERKHNESLISYDFTDTDTESALTKLRAAALKHDKNHPAAVSLSAFEVSSMAAADFQELCRRVFRIELTGRELGAVASLCGSLPGQPKSPPRSRSPTMRAPSTAQKQRAFEMGSTGSGTIDNSDLESVKSGKSSRGQRAAIPVRAQTSHAKRPEAAIPAVPDQAMINCNEFMLMFSQLQRAEKSTVRSKRASLIHQIQRARAEEQRKQEQRSLQKAADLIKHSEADVATLMDKLNEAAQKFAMDNAAYLTQMQSFKGPSTTAAAFRDTFFRIFLIRLSFAEVGALTHVLNPELAKESLVNGNTFLTSFYRLSRYHEKILLGLPLDDNIHDVSILLPKAILGDDGSISGVFSRSSSAVGGKSGPLRRGRSRGGNKLPVLDVRKKPQQDDDLYRNSGRKEKGKHSTGVGTDMLSSFKYSGVFDASSVEEFHESRAIPVERAEFPFSLDSPRRGVIKLSRQQLPSPQASRPASPRGNPRGGMLASMFSGVNPWTASSDELGAIGVVSPPKLAHKANAASSPAQSRATSPAKRISPGNS